MKFKPATVLAVLLFLSCSKENNFSKKSTSGIFNDAPVLPQLIPLNDLGTGTFKDSVGGLYPDGKNHPTHTYAKDLMKVCSGIVPIDTFGNVSDKGFVVFISLGGSTGGHNMAALIEKTRGNTLTYSKLKIMNCNQPAQKAPLSSIIDTTTPYWLHIDSVLTTHKSNERQVQVLYLETDDSTFTPKFPDRANILKGYIESTARILKIRMPNLKIIYLLGRTRTFSNTVTPWNSEPSPYFFGWACKWAIQDQIQNIPATKYKGNNIVAPMLAWGFYQWADSLPRKTDDFYWRFSETKDGLHANDVGQDTLSTRFQNFLLTDPYAKLWYGAH